MKFRKKPVVIEAMQWDGSATSANAIAKWVDQPWGVDPSRTVLEVPTLEGLMQASKGDWIIRGVKGEFYPCKPDVFAATYEAVDSDDRTSASPPSTVA